MSEILTIALYAEGTTDYKFFRPLIERVVKQIILESEYDIELHPILEIPKQSAISYPEEIESVAKKAHKSGIKCLIVHCDSDSRSSNNVLTRKISPAFSIIEGKSEVCNRIIPLIPIQMTESWLMADLDLLKAEINAESINNRELKFNKLPERIADPKKIIKEAIAVAQNKKTKRRRNFNVSELYSPIGQKVDLDKLNMLESYKVFYSKLKEICLPYC